MRVTHAVQTPPHAIWLVQQRLSDPHAFVPMSVCARIQEGWNWAWALHASKVSETCASIGASFVTSRYAIHAAWPSGWPL